MTCGGWSFNAIAATLEVFSPAEFSQAADVAKSMQKHYIPSLSSSSRSRTFSLGSPVCWQKALQPTSMTSSQ